MRAWAQTVAGGLSLTAHGCGCPGLEGAQGCAQCPMRDGGRRARCYARRPPRAGRPWWRLQDHAVVQGCSDRLRPRDDRAFQRPEGRRRGDLVVTASLRDEVRIVAGHVDRSGQPSTGEPLSPVPQIVGHMADVRSRVPHQVGVTLMPRASFEQLTTAGRKPFHDPDRLLRRQRPAEAAAATRIAVQTCAPLLHGLQPYRGTHAGPVLYPPGAHNATLFIVQSCSMRKICLR